jgi:hypothetical protein
MSDGIGWEQKHFGPIRFFSEEKGAGQPETGPLGSILDLQWPYLKAQFAIVPLRR